MAKQTAEKTKDVVVAGVPASRVAAIEQVIRQADLANLAGGADVVAPALRLAEGINTLRKLLTDDTMKPIMALQGTPLGFLTDKDKAKGYPLEVVRDCLIEALLRGVRPVGNEFNIIAGRLYCAQAGFARLVREFPGLTNLKTTLHLKEMSKAGAKVDGSATWNLNGQPQELSTEIPIRVNEYMGADAVLGKGYRKLLHQIYRQLTGTHHLMMPEGDVDDALAEAAPRPALTPGRHAIDPRQKVAAPEAETETGEQPATETAAVDTTTGEISEPDAELPSVEEMRAAILVLDQGGVSPGEFASMCIEASVKPDVPVEDWSEASVMQFWAKHRAVMSGAE